MKVSRKISSLLAILAGLFLAGCVTWPNTIPATEFIHVNSREDAMKRVNAWANASLGRTWSTVAFTGSMRPILNGGEYLLKQTYTGQALTAGQLVVFYRDEGAPRVVHRIIEIKDGAAYLSGDANKYSDGWFPLNRVNEVVVTVITFPR